MTKYHPLYAYAIVGVVLILGIQMMISNGGALTGLAVGDQGMPQGSPGGQQQMGGQQGSSSQQGGQQNVQGQAGCR